MLTAIVLLLHALAATVWVGGMFFAYVVLRPATSEMELPARQDLWRGVFQRFFTWVWAAVVILPLSGYFHLFRTFKGFIQAGIHVHVMHLVAWIMIALFLYLYFVPYKGFLEAIDAGDRPDAGEHINHMRRILLVNLCLGLAVVAIGTSGKYWALVSG